MRFISLLRKTVVENFRDWKISILTLTFAPFFVVLMYFYLVEVTEAYRVIVVNRDAGVITPDGRLFTAGEEIISLLREVESSGGAALLEVRLEADAELAREQVDEDSADLVVEIPEQFSDVLLSYSRGDRPPPTVVRTYGDPANARYIMAAAFCDYTTYEYASRITGLQSPLELRPESAGQAESLSDFDLYMPALLALAVMMLMFTAAASIIKEKDKGTLIRLRISNMTTFEWLSAVSVVQLLIGLLAVGLTYLTAVMLGFEGSGSFPAMTAVSLLSCMSIIAISLLVAGSLRTVFDLVTIGCFPFFILMFFSGGMFPLPQLRLISLGGRPLHVNEVLPTTHTISALDTILNSGGGLGDVAYELAAITALTVFFFTLGTWLFTRRHMRAW